MCIIPASSTGNSHSKVWDSAGTVVDGTLRHVEEDLWVLAYHKAAINHSYGGRFQCHQQGNLRYLHAIECAEIQNDARGGIQQEKLT